MPRYADTNTMMTVHRNSVEDTLGGIPPHYVNNLDPTGYHLCTKAILANDTVMNTLWMIKLADSDIGVDIHLKMSIDDYNKLPVVQED